MMVVVVVTLLVTMAAVVVAYSMSKVKHIWFPCMRLSICAARRPAKMWGCTTTTA